MIILEKGWEMKAKKLKISLLVFFFFLAGLIILMNITITSPRLKDAAVSRLEKVLGRPVAIGQLRINLRRGIELKGLSIKNQEDFQPGTFVQVKTLIIRYKLLPLLQRKLVIGRVILINPRILLERNREGKWNFSGFPVPGDKTPVSRAGFSAGEISLFISKITLSGGEVILRDETTANPPPEAKLEALNLDISDFSLSSPFRFRLNGDLAGEEPANFTLEGKADISQPSKSDVNLTINNLSLSFFQPYLRGDIPFTNLTGKSNLKLNCQMDEEKNLYLKGKITGKDIGLQFLSSPSAEKFPLERIDKLSFSLDLNKLTGQVTRPLKISRLEGKLNITGGEIKLSRVGVPLTNIKGKLKIEGNKISLSNLKANLGEGTIGLRGEVKSPVEDLPDLSQLTYSFQVDWQNLDLNSLLSSTDLPAMVSGKLAGQASLQGRKLSPEAISGQGEMQIKQGQLSGMPLMRLLVSLLGVPSLAEINFQELYADFSLKDKIIRSNNIRLLSRDVDMFAKGSIDFDTRLNYELTLRMSPELSAKSLFRLKYLQDKKGRTVIKAKVTGSFKHPKVDLLGNAVEQIIRKGLKDILKSFGN